jgi:hypothetical protein
MIFKKENGLKEGMLPTPVIYHSAIDTKDLLVVKKTDLDAFFTAKGHSLKTWGRTPNVKTLDPHFIGVRGQTPLHTDPAYPRYSHQLKIYVNNDIYATGYNGEKYQLHRGFFYCLDTHSPHQILAPKNGYNISISVDSDYILEQDVVLKMILDYNEKKKNENIFT